MNVKIFKGNKNLFFKDAEYIRTKVFVEEQGVPYENEIDFYDEIATHIVMYHLNNPIAVGRIVEINGELKIGRIAVIKEFRKEGYGKQLMDIILCVCKKEGSKKIKLNAQLTALNFYEKLGFVKKGEVFQEENIDHISMEFKERV